MTIRLPVSRILLAVLALGTNAMAMETPDLFPIGAFPTDLSELSVQRHISGGSGGVFVLKDQSNQLFTLKGAKHADQLKEEVLTDALYQAFGVPVPAFIVVPELPNSILKEVQLHQMNGPFRIAQFIQPAKTDAPKETTGQLNKFLAVDAFLSNHDRAGAQLDNVIVDEHGVLWRIDNGGGLRFRATGDKKEISGAWDPNWVSEMLTLRDVKEIDGAVLGAQAIELVQRFPEAHKTLKELGTSLNIVDFEELENTLVSRYRYLATRYTGALDPIAHIYEPAVSQNTSASVFIYRRFNDEAFVLLGKRAGTGLLGNLGGASDRSDKLLADVASRELLEESMSLINISGQTILDLPSHDLLMPHRDYGFTRHRMYFYELQQDFDISKLNEALKSPPNSHKGEVEYTEFKWVSVNELVKALQSSERIKRPPSRSNGSLESTIQLSFTDEEVVLHPPFYHMLIQPPVYSQLRNLTGDRTFVGKMNLVKQHTQGWLMEAESCSLSDLGPKGHFVNWTDNTTCRVMDNHYPRLESLNEQSMELALTVIDRAKVLGQIKNIDSERVNRVFAKTNQIEDQTTLLIRKNWYTGEYEFDVQNQASKTMRLPQPARIAPHDLKRANTESSHPLLSDLKMSQTEAYLRNQFEAYDDNKTLYDNSVSFLKEHVKHHAKDPVFLDVIKDILSVEQAHRTQFFTFYSAANSEIGFLTEVMTEARNILEGSNADDFKLLRGKDGAFEYLNVLEFLKHQGDVRDELAGKQISKALDYTPGFQDQAVSASSSVFGSHLLELESALHFFLRRQSIAPPSLDMILNKFFKQFGVRIDAEAYKTLFETYFESESDGDALKRSNTTFFQLFLHPEVMDQMTYNSGTGGGLVNFLNDDVQPKNSLVQLMNEPRLANKSAVHNHQVKLLLHPNVVHNADLFRVKQYWRKPLSKVKMAEFKQRLSKLIRLDLARALHQKIANRENTFRTESAKNNGTLSPTEKLFELAYEDILDVPLHYKSAEATDADLVAMLQDKDYNEFLTLFPRWEERSTEKLDHLFSIAVKNLLNDPTQSRQINDILELLLREGKILTQDELTGFIQGIRRESESNLIDNLKTLLAQTSQVSIEALFHCAGTLNSIQLTDLLLEKTINNLAFGKMTVEMILTNVLFSAIERQTKLALLDKVARKFWPIADSFLHEVFRQKDWEVLELLANIDLDRVLLMSVHRVLEPSLEPFRQLFPKEHSLDRDNEVDPASYEVVRKLVAKGPSDDGIDAAITAALWHSKPKVLLDLAPRKPMVSPKTDSMLARLIGSYQGDAIFEGAIIFREYAITNLFLAAMDSVTSHHFITAVRAGNNKVIAMMAEKKADLVGPLQHALLEGNLDAIRSIVNRIDYIPCFVFSRAVETFNREIIELIKSKTRLEDFGVLLMEAVRHQHEELFSELLVDPRTQPGDLVWALTTALRRSPDASQMRERIYAKLTDLAAKGVQLSLDNAILECISEGHFEFLKRIVADFKPGLNFTLFISPVSAAIIADEPEMLEFLLQNGADPNYHKPYLPSPLMFAVKRQFETDVTNATLTKFFKLLGQEFGEDYVYSRFDESQLNAYLGRPSDANTVGKRVHGVLEQINLRLVKILLAADANPQPELALPEHEQFSNSPLQLAESLRQYEIVKLLADAIVARMMN